MNGDLAVIDILRNDATAGGLVGGTGVVDARVFLSELPQGEVYPAYVVEVFDTEPFDTKDGPSATDHDMVKVTCYAAQMSEAVALQNAARSVVDGNSGSFNGYDVEWIRYLGGDARNEPETNRKIFVRELDFEVRIKTGL